MSELREAARTSGTRCAAGSSDQGIAGKVGKQFLEQPSSAVVGSSRDDSYARFVWSSRSQGASRPLAASIFPRTSYRISCQQATNLSPLWLRVGRNGNMRFAHPAADRAAEHHAHHTRDPLSYDRMSPLPRKNNGQTTCRIWGFSLGTSFDRVHRSSATTFSPECQANARSSQNTHRRCGRYIHRYNCPCRTANESGVVPALPGNQGRCEVFGYRLDRRNRLALWQQASMALGGSKPRRNSVSNRCQAKRQRFESLARLVLRHRHLGSMDCLRNDFGGTQTTLLQSFEAGFSETDRSWNGRRTPGPVGADGDQALPSTLASLQATLDHEGRVRVFDESHSSALQTPVAQRHPTGRPQGRCTVQKYSTQFEICLDIRSSSGCRRTYEQSGRKSSSIACNLAKSIAGKQNRTRNNLCPAALECHLHFETARKNSLGLFGTGYLGPQPRRFYAVFAARAGWLTHIPDAIRIAPGFGGDQFAFSENLSHFSPITQLNTYLFLMKPRITFLNSDRHSVGAIQFGSFKNTFSVIGEKSLGK